MLPQYFSGLVGILLSVQLLLPGLAGADLSDGLVAYYPLDGSGIDASGNANHGSVTGAVESFDRFGSPASAYDFSNDPTHGTQAQDYIIVPDSPSLKPAGAITLAVWAKTSNSSGRGIAGKQFGSSTLDSYLLWYNTGTLWFTLSDFGNAAVNAPIPSLGEWHHLAGTWDGNTVRLYVDGVGVAERLYVGPNQFDTNPFVIGADNDDSDESPDDGWDGDIDDVRIYNRALLESEIQQLAGIAAVPTLPPAALSALLAALAVSGTLALRLRR